ncbi:hypothetical protein BDK51DRAFT_48057 [Blyttiomyces helicus]|uniref:Fibronectin type-III domain-containing protein n=1 Tax=Blyttiomyces helicus TaxID=388810 RepID=A0A4P9W175_9FUNG|nr:hypothetical protein BDK51DRAFT_48057 [Blyttiomyces helicus]|eukprot:RKO85392.1 hypothetical protein BDK51DRAFT_48057 [Blyttiomyces helicus]
MVDNVRHLPVELDCAPRKEPVDARRFASEESVGSGRRENGDGEGGGVREEGQRMGGETVGGGEPAAEMAGPPSREASESGREVQGVAVAVVVEPVQKMVRIVGLEAGRYYFFQLVAGHEDVDGPPTPIEGILVDALPTAPPKPSVAITPGRRAISVLIQHEPATGGSKALRYKVYHSNDASMQEHFLVAEIDVAAAAAETNGDGPLAFDYDAPQIAVPHYFRVAAVNLMGEGPSSVPSEEAFIVQISTTVSTEGQSEVESYVVIVHRESTSDPETLPLKTEQLLVPATAPSGPAEMVHTIDNLTPGMAYRFQVEAVNRVGRSEPSENSDRINFDVLIPVPDRLTAEILSPTSVRLVMPTVPASSNVPIVGYRVASEGAHGPVPQIEAAVIPTIQRELLVDGLVPEGVFSPPVFVPLAGECAACGEGDRCLARSIMKRQITPPPPLAAIPIPPSPPPTPRAPSRSEDLPPLSETQDTTPEPAPLTKTASRSSTLSMNQKVVNMHNGMPANHDPVVATPDAGAAVDEKVVVQPAPSPVLVAHPQPQPPSGSHAARQDAPGEKGGKGAAAKLRMSKTRLNR